MDITIIYEDENVVAINKPAGLLVHPTQSSSAKASEDEQKTLTSFLLTKYPEIATVGDPPSLSATDGQVTRIRPGIVHRLDKDTSGVMIVAKNQPTFEFLKKQFQNREIKKTYIALVSGEVNPPAGGKGTINLPIGRSPAGGKKLASLKARGELREAQTDYEILKYFKDPKNNKTNFTLLQISPKTGRTHQIRVHMKAIGHPVVCDRLYTEKPDCPCGLARQFLHAKSLEIKIPNDTKMLFEAELPEDLVTVLNNLKECDKND